jgi:excisionase family DNA binding protein
MSDLSAKPWLTVEEAALALSVHPNTIRRAIASKELVATKLGKGWRITLEALQEYEKKRRNIDAAA